MLDKIKDFFKDSDLDIRKSNYSRFIDQKVTPDVLCFIADCVDNLVASQVGKEFTTREVWDSMYFKKNVEIFFKKPSADNENASNEYDKFINQPLRMLNYAGVLESEKRGAGYVYKIKDLEMLKYVALKERNAANFLYEYILKVLSDSDMLRHFEEYENLYHQKKLTSAGLKDLKGKFQKFMFGNTEINKPLEVNRIFPKVLNLFANYRDLPGTVRGNLSKDSIAFYDLMYNDVNFRDLGKQKSMTRQEANDLDKLIAKQEDHNAYQISKAMRIIKEKYSVSEVNDRWGVGSADHVHHIFPRAQFPQLAVYLENLIKLTATQHLSKAHPSGSTAVVDKDYQLVCLISKSNSIEKSLAMNELIYSKENFVFVANTGLSLSLPESLDFQQIRLKLNNVYKNS